MVRGRKVVLVSSEGNLFEVSYAAAIMSNVIKDQLDDDEDEEIQEFPIPNVRTGVLSKVVKFINYHHVNPMREIPKPIKTKFEDVVGPWDLDFINAQYEMIFELILAANYLDIKSLLELASAKVSGIIFGKTPDQVCEIFGIEQPFTPEEEKFIRDEHAWPEE
ncbi:suppressor of kinetochore protein mutant [Aphanomyces cochlioides]|nr:suppressor of kinetochore protein mutant [Aphanomyces cochlioides]